MAPSTNVGAAHPVGLSGAIESEKATNDAAAYIRGIAESHGRNATWAEQAVRDSVSISARQALDENVIDLIAPTTGALLDEVDGMTVALNVGDVIVHTAGARIEELHMGAFSSFLHALLDPNLAFLFFWFGLALLALELFVPGGIAGTVGALMLVASLVALGMLPVQLIGVALLVASVVFFVLELVHPGIGLPTAGGVITLVLGGWFLFDASVPGVRVSPFVIVPVAGLAVLFFGFVIQQAIRLRRRRGETRIDTLVGREGVVLRDLAPSGVVQLASEEWSAEVVSGSAAKGDPVRVVAVDGLRLKVEPIAQEAPTGSASEGGSP
jgi:membrane-bound serine protease (ClpP class)